MVKSAPAVVLELSTAQGPTTSGGNFSYTLSYHNGTASALAFVAAVSEPLRRIPAKDVVFRDLTPEDRA